MLLTASSMLIPLTLIISFSPSKMQVKPTPFDINNVTSMQSAVATKSLDRRLGGFEVTHRHLRATCPDLSCLAHNVHFYRFRMNGFQSR